MLLRDHVLPVCFLAAPNASKQRTAVQPLAHLDITCQRQNLVFAYQKRLLSVTELYAALQQLNNAIYLEEQQHAGIALGEEIRGEIPNIPIIFTSLERIHSQALPRGETFCLVNDSDTLASLVEQMIGEQRMLPQTEHGETAIVLELPRRVAASYMLAGT